MLSKLMPLRRGMTLLEVLITLAITATVLTLGLMTLRGYLPKQRLNASTQALAAVLEKAQMNGAKGLPICLNFSEINTTGRVQMYIFPNDTPANMTGPNCAATTAGIINLGSVPVLKDSIQLASCTGSVAPSCVMWIRKDGVPILCANSGSCAGTSPGSGCTSVGIAHQFILSSSKLDTTVKAKEVEVTESGLVNITKFGEKGYDATVWAKYPNDSGTGTSCE